MSAYVTSIECLYLTPNFEVGYDSNMMYLASYDWRLSYHNLEVRDRFFTKLKAQIELNKKIYGKKTVVMTHSMGAYMQSIDACVIMF
jgi:hypothetical protein